MCKAAEREVGVPSLRVSEKSCHRLSLELVLIFFHGQSAPSSPSPDSSPRRDAFFGFNISFYNGKKWTQLLVRYLARKITTARVSYAPRRKGPVYSIAASTSCAHGTEQTKKKAAGLYHQEELGHCSRRRHRSPYTRPSRADLVYGSRASSTPGRPVPRPWRHKQPHAHADNELGLQVRAASDREQPLADSTLCMPLCLPPSLVRIAGASRA